MRLTKADIEAGKSPKGGYTRVTLEKWGIPWPPPKGWRRELLRKGYFDASRMPIKRDAERQEPYLPTVADVAQQYLGRWPTEAEIHGEIRVDDLVIRYTCIRPAVRVLSEDIPQMLIDQLTPPKDFL